MSQNVQQYLNNQQFVPKTAQNQPVVAIANNFQNEEIHDSVESDDEESLDDENIDNGNLQMEIEMIEAEGLHNL